jgi:hypothetical protein
MITAREFLLAHTHPLYHFKYSTIGLPLLHLLSYTDPNFPLPSAQLSQESQSFGPASPYSSRMRLFPLIRETTHLTSMRRSDILLLISRQWRLPPRATHRSPELRNPVIRRKLGWGRVSVACSMRSTSWGSFQLPQSLLAGRAEIL